MRLTSTLASSMLAGSLVLVGAAPAHADETPCMRGVPGDSATATEVDKDADEENETLTSLRLDEVHQLATGKGVGVAVIDSGISTSKTLSVRAGKSFVTGKVEDGHGTIVAGVIAGRGDATGIAPGAEIYDLRVAAGPVEGEATGPSKVQAGDVTAAVKWASANRDKIAVINISIGFEKPNKALAAAIDAAIAKGIVVVAAAGNRDPDAEPEDEESEGAQGQDEPPAAPDEVLFPASMDGVIAVTSRSADLSMTSEAVLVGPEIDVSAPVVGLRSVMLRNLVCTVSDPASSWATAVVSGVAALLLEGQRLSPAQVKTRIEVTAQGGGNENAMDGHGMVQPYEALTRKLAISTTGELRTERARSAEDYVAAKPAPLEDRSAERRRALLWWGMGAGGLLVLALVLRPLLARRRG
ncbi:MAG TPA: S8 family serine peptidase [Nocardioides sp.]